MAAIILAITPLLVPAPAFGAATLSDGSVTPTEGTTATSFTFSVHYTSTDSPRRPAQEVNAQVGSVTVPLAKVSGTGHDGTWQGSATLPAGTWAVTFHARTSGESQPAPLAGPIVTVTAPPPTPTPAPTQPPTAAPTPPPSSPSTPWPTAPMDRTPQPAPESTEVAQDDESPPRSSRRARASASPTATPASAGSPNASSTRRASPDSERSGSPEPTDFAHRQTEDPQRGSMFANFLIVGGTMSIAGAAVLARQWLVTRGRPG